MSVEWALNIEIYIYIQIADPVFKGKGEIRNCSYNRVVKLLEHRMKIAEMVLRRIWRIVTANEMEFGIMPERGTTHAVFILRRLQEEYHVKGKKLYMFCGPRESF